LVGHDGQAWSISKRSSMRITASAGYQVSPVTQRLVANSPVGSPHASIEIATRWLSASAPAGQSSLACGQGSGATPPGMPPARRKVWKCPCSGAPRWAW